MNPESIDMVYSLKSYALQVSGNAADADDIIQDIFVRILKNPEKFEHLNLSEKKQYILGAIHNQKIDRHRRLISKGKVKYHLQIEKTHASTPPEAYAKIELKHILEKARKFWMCESQLLLASGYSIREIEKMTGQKRNTVLARCRYGRNYLREQ